MSALHLAKKFWIIMYMKVLLCCHGFGLFVRAITYINPNLIFHKKLQDYLEIIFKFFVILWCVSWAQSLLIYFIQLVLVNYGFDKDTTYGCEDGICDSSQKMKETSQYYDEYRLNILFRVIQFFFGWVLFGMLVNLIGVDAIMDWVDERVDIYYSTRPT